MSELIVFENVEPKPAPASGAVDVGPVERWKTILSAKAAKWGMPAGDEWRCLLHNNYHPTVATINVLWFHQDEYYPRAFTKVRKEDVLIREFKKLEAIHQAAGDYVPKPLSVDKVDGVWMLWMAGVPGSRIPPRKTYRRAELVSIIDMLSSIHGAVKKSSGEHGSERHACMVAKPLEALIQFGDSTIVREGCAELVQSHSVAWMNALPVIPQHGDLFLDNILRHEDRLYVVDWEYFGVVDLPFYDLLTLLFSMLRVSGETPDSFDPELVQQVPFLVERYARSLGLPVSLMAELLPLLMANWFYLYWVEGKEPMAAKAYRTIAAYFMNRRAWGEIFVGVKGAK